MKKLVMLLFCIILLVPLALAVPPSDIIIFSPDNGLEVQTPLIEYHKQNTDLHLRFHVFNSSDGVLKDNTTVSCEIHIYNTSNKCPVNVESMETGVNGHCFKIDVDRNNFTELGHYYYFINCNNSLYGGFSAASFEVTDSGAADDNLDTSSGNAIGLFLLFITIMLFVFPIIKDFTKHKWANNIIRRAFWTVGLFVLMWNASIFATIADAANLDIVSHLFSYMRIFGWAGYVSAVYLVLKSLFELLKTYKIHKDKKRYGDKNGF